MKTLDQIEARTAIPKGSAIPTVGSCFTISQPGSYDLVGNIAVSTGDAIVIASIGINGQVQSILNWCSAVSSAEIGTIGNILCNFTASQVGISGIIAKNDLRPT